MADQADGSPVSPTGKVQFTEGVGDRPHPIKHVPTQRYDRREIQKRLDVESWMDSALRALYDNDEDVPELDIDDVLSIEATERQDRLKEYLKESKKPVTMQQDFIKDLLEKVSQFKPIKS